MAVTHGQWNGISGIVSFLVGLIVPTLPHLLFAHGIIVRPTVASSAPLVLLLFLIHVPVVCFVSRYLLPLIFNAHTTHFFRVVSLAMGMGVGLSHFVPNSVIDSLAVAFCCFAIGAAAFAPTFQRQFPKRTEGETLELVWIDRLPYCRLLVLLMGIANALALTLVCILNRCGHLWIIGALFFGFLIGSGVMHLFLQLTKRACKTRSDEWLQAELPESRIADNSQQAAIRVHKETPGARREEADE